MKKIILQFLIIFTIPFFSYAENTFEGFAHRIESWAEGLSGYVVSSNGVTIDLGKNHNVVTGMEFVTSRDGEALIHPVTGKSLGKKNIITGKIAISNVEKEYSTCKTIENNGIKKGDRITHVSPIPVNFSTNLLSEEESAKVGYEIFKSSHIVKDESSDYSITCGRENSGSKNAKCSLSFKGKTIFSNDIAVKGIKIITTASADEEKPIKIEEDVISMTVGYFEGKESNYLIALAGRSKIFIYEAVNNKLLQKGYISSISGNIINIESVDINNNGKDEIFVSVLNKKYKPTSYIFEYDGKTYKLLSKDIPYLFRTYYTGGKKHLICQNYSEGIMIDKIYNVSYSKKEYKYDTSYFADKYVGASIYGFGEIGSEGNVFFNRHGLLNFVSNKNVIVYNEMDFSNTPNYITYSEKQGTGVNVGQTPESGGYFVYDEKDIIVPIYQRIIQLSDGSLLLYKNKLKTNNVLGNYVSGSIGGYFLTNNNITSAWVNHVTGNAVNDVDILGNGKVTVYIVSKNKNGQEDNYLYINK